VCAPRRRVCRDRSLISPYANSEKYADGHGILEFSTDKAGQDVTPMNLKFDDEAIQTRGSTLNSISGESIPFRLSGRRFRRIELSRAVNTTKRTDQYIRTSRRVKKSSTYFFSPVSAVVVLIRLYETSS